MAEVEFTQAGTVTLIGRYDKALINEAMDRITGDQVMLSMIRNYDGRNVPALCINTPGGEGRAIGLASAHEVTGKQRNLQE